MAEWMDGWIDSWMNRLRETLGLLLAETALLIK
jgi:hypothetical protein